MNLSDAPDDAPADGERTWTDEELFKEPPPSVECPICFLPPPLDESQIQYRACCGKNICAGCVYADMKENNRTLCPFCRTPEPTSDSELIERMKERAGGDDSVAIYNLGCYYRDGGMGLRQNNNKANKLWIRAGELGYAAAYNNVGNSYRNGRGVERDVGKARYYFELAAMGGDVKARHNLGVLEKREGNMNRAVKHFAISAGAGDDESLTAIRKYFLNGHATKDDFEMALRVHKEAADEMKSDQREAAASFLASRRGV